MLNKMMRMNDEYHDVKMDFKRKLNEKLAKMGLYGFSRVKIYSDYLDIRLQRELSDIQIETLEKEFHLRLTSYKYVHIKNIDEPIDSWCGIGECKFYLYRFRGDKYGN